MQQSFFLCFATCFAVCWRIFATEIEGGRILKKTYEGAHSLAQLCALNSRLSVVLNAEAETSGSRSGELAVRRRMLYTEATNIGS